MYLNSIGQNQTEIHKDNGSKWFFSYNTLVLIRTKDGRIIQTTHKYSNTTTRHINKTLERWGVTPDEMMQQEDLNELMRLEEI